MAATPISFRFSNLTDSLIAAWMPFVTAAVLALGSMAASAAAVDSQASSYRELAVEVIGNGRPLVMIPGLNSAADTWRETCAALQPEVQCHLLQLPGFAGQPPAQQAIEGDAFLDAMRDRVLAYVDELGLRSPVVIGHSLGGLLALKMALKSPKAFSRLIIVDSLPFFPAAQNPAATVASVTPMAEGMRQSMQAADDESFFRNAPAALAGMSRSPERVKTLAEWGRASDRATTTQAMYELMTTDLRADIKAIHTPTLVLGAWAAYAPYGSTRESTEAIFRSQYAALDGVRIEMSETGYHFLMWDDPQWLQSQVRAFLSTDTQTGK
jgi:pimeloyl-ACP methyl ester carboxylesterase